MPQSNIADLHRLVWLALCAALMAVGSYVSIPVGAVPFTMQTFFVMLAGLILGPVRAPLAAALFVAAGLLGLPIFVGGRSGLAVLLGPTGGYLFGYILAAAAIGAGSMGRPDARVLRLGLAVLAGLVCIYLPGVVQLKLVLAFDWPKALAVGFAPFILWDIIKAVLAVVTYRFLAARRLLPR